MAAKQGKNSIEIERNVIEKNLMKVKDFFKENSTKTLPVLIGVLIVIVISISIYIYIDNISARELEKYESIIDTYKMNPTDKSVKDNTISSLRELVKNSKYGFVNQMSYYMLGNLLFDDEKYAESYDMFSAFVKKTSSEDLLKPLAINKMSMCMEEQGKVDEALNLLLKYESDSKEVIVRDQVIYNIARIYSLKGEKIKAREYFNHVISAYPESTFATRAKERLMLSGIK